ncbi:MAG: EamA family transporter RarD [Shimia sp.]
MATTETPSSTPDAAPDARDRAGDTRAGFLFALGAFGLWGALPLYMKALEHVPAGEVVAHRVVWSVPVAAAVLIALGRTDTLRQALREPRTLAMAGVTAVLISTNWLVYVWAVIHDRAMDAAIGYYINPLFSVLLGAVVLGERLGRAQWVAVGLATAAVAVLTIEAGRLPVVALAMTVTFGLYALAKRALPIGPNQGFLLEVLILTPPALAFLAWRWAQGDAAFGTDAGTTALLIGSGLVTAVPLMLYANGAKGLRLATIGMMQYIAPTAILLIAVFLFGEPFGAAQAIAFPLIWGALAVYAATLLRRPE